MGMVGDSYERYQRISFSVDVGPNVLAERENLKDYWISGAKISCIENFHQSKVLKALINLWLIYTNSEKCVGYWMQVQTCLFQIF